MKTICPNCELYLVEVAIDGGFCTFYCERCASKDEKQPPVEGQSYS